MIVDAGRHEPRHQFGRRAVGECHEHGIGRWQLGVDGLSDTCRGCPVVESCGGGLYAHRWAGVSVP